MSTFFFLLPFLVVYTVLVVYAERKVSAFMQSRLGPMEVGYYGILQTLADLLKLLQKEDIRPAGVVPVLFKAAPVIIFVAIFGGFSVLPLHPEWAGAPLSSGIFFLLAIISLDVVGILVAGWSSHNKYSTLGAFRAAAQIISYEIPLSLCLVAVVMHAGTLDLQVMAEQQGILSAKKIYAFGKDITTVGGVFTWNIVQMPWLFFVWLIFFVASLAECNRAPFDLPEGESELVAGYHTEYSGFRFAVIMLAEYALMLLVSFLGSILFFGAWNTPLPNVGSWPLATWTTGPLWGVTWLVSKTLLLVILQIWVRWTFPRVRIDQLTSTSWKYLTPLALFFIFLIGVSKLVN
jgi:NADH-quinone oxidoreductase subunit H